MSGELRVVSFGGGVQSTALLVLAAQGKIDFKTFIFADVGDDSEAKATQVYVRDVAVPFARQHGLNILTCHRTRADGSQETVYQRALSSRGWALPMRLDSGKPARRRCTSDFKVEVVHKQIKLLQKIKWMNEKLDMAEAMGISIPPRLLAREWRAYKEDPAVLAIGISWDEMLRAKQSKVDFAIHCWPLLDLRFTRRDCELCILAAGLPLPPKSACWFCPYHSLEVWARMKREDPDTFWAAVAFEAEINRLRAEAGEHPVWLTDAMMPLDKAVGDGTQLELFGKFEEHNCGAFTCEVA